jgi:hypothetical protein
LRERADINLPFLYRLDASGAADTGQYLDGYVGMLSLKILGHQFHYAYARSCTGNHQGFLGAGRNRTCKNGSRKQQGSEYNNPISQIDIHQLVPFQYSI